MHKHPKKPKCKPVPPPPRREEPLTTFMSSTVRWLRRIAEAQEESAQALARIAAALEKPAEDHNPDHAVWRDEAPQPEKS